MNPPSIDQTTANPLMAVGPSDEIARVCAPSFSQQALWVLCQVTADEPVYNESNVFRLKGKLDLGALTKAVEEIVCRHESLRTRFRSIDGAPMQEILAKLEVPVEITNLGAWPEEQREAQARLRMQDEVSARFDLEQGPLIRVRLLRLTKDEHWLVLAMHHIIRDGTSSVIFAQELSALYRAYRSGHPSPLERLPIQYADFASWQRQWLTGAEAREHLRYWKQALAELPVLELPTDRPRPPVPSGRGGRVVIELKEDLTGRLKELRRREGTTLFTTLLAAFQVLLYRYSGQEDIAVGVPVAGRSHPGSERLIGYFVNMLVLRGDLSGEPTFKQYLARVQQRTREAYAHQEVPFPKLVEEFVSASDPSRNPLFQASLVKGTEANERPELEGITVEDLDIRGPETVKFDLSFSVIENGGKLRVGIEYASDLFDAASIERMAGHWRNLLEAIVADPEQRISQLPLLSAAERQPLTPPLSITAASTRRCLHELFEAQVRRTPQATALVFEGEALLYAELNARANRLAHYLRTLGGGPEARVAIAMERSLEMVVGLLGILKAGAAYVPLDPSYPAARLAFMLEDTQAPVLLTQERVLARLPAYSGRTVCLDRDWGSIATQPDRDPSPAATAENLAYVIYTSGSTGQPKGVMIEHGSVVNYLSWIGETFALAATDRVLQKTPLGFDASVEEIFFPLTNGAVLVIARPDLHPATSDIVALIQSETISVLQVVPSLLAALLDQAEFRQCASLRLILCGGEALSPELTRRLHEASGAELVNLYGPTETTISSTFWRCRPDALSDAVPIGHPIANTRVIVVDRNMQPVPVGAAGELCIGGAGVARGYFNQQPLTAHCFVADPWSEDPQARLYKTGDRVRRLADGSLEFVGRSDHQIKLRGFRIEPGEIEAALRQHEAIREAIVAAPEDRLGDKRLVAYVVSARARSVGSDELRAFLLQRLPAHMVPTAFVSLRELPLGPGGKVDRNQLPDFTPDLQLGAQPHVDPRNAVEVQLMRIWERILDVSPIGMLDNFFELGGDSLAAVNVIDRIEQLFGRQLPPDILWYQDGTIEALARALVDKRGPPLWSGPVPIKPTGKRRPLFCPHIVGGHLFFYDNLARHVSEDQPLYGLPARGFDGKTPADSSIEAMAEHCIRSMRHVQPRGPYSLAGYCSGGLIAFEMARQLHAQGERVELLALCDSLAPSFHPLELARTTWNFLLLRNVRSVQQRVYRFVLQNLGLSRLRKFRTVTEAHFWAFLSYRPQPYHGSAVLFRAANADDSRSPSLGWKRLARAGVEVCVIPCAHSAMVKEPMVRVLADRLETYLGRIADASRDKANGPVLLGIEPAPSLQDAADAPS